MLVALAGRRINKAQRLVNQSLPEQCLQRSAVRTWGAGACEERWQQGIARDIVCDLAWCIVDTHFPGMYLLLENSANDLRRNSAIV